MGNIASGNGKMHTTAALSGENAAVAIARGIGEQSPVKRITLR